MRALSLPPLHRLAGLAPLALRLGVGLVFIVHGWQKLTGGPASPDGFAGMLTGLGVPAPGLFAWLVTAAELGGGILILVGLLTRLATLPLIANLIGAIVLVKTDLGIVAPMGAPLPGAEVDIALIAGMVALLLLGPRPPVRRRRRRHRARHRHRHRAHQGPRLSGRHGTVRPGAALWSGPLLWSNRCRGSRWHGERLRTRRAAGRLRAVRRAGAGGSVPGRAVADGPAGGRRGPRAGHADAGLPRGGPLRRRATPGPGC